MPQLAYEKKHNSKSCRELQFKIVCHREDRMVAGSALEFICIIGLGLLLETRYMNIGCAALNILHIRIELLHRLGMHDMNISIQSRDRSFFGLCLKQRKQHKPIKG